MNSSLSINSAISVAAAFLLMHFLNEYATALTASYFGLKPILYLEAIKYHAYDVWTPYSVKRTFLASGIMNLIAGIIFFRMFLMVKKSNKWYRLFFLWCSVIGLVMFLGKLLSVPFYEFKPDPPGHIAFGVVIAYEYVGEPFKWAIAAFSILLMIAAGLFFTYQFLRNAESKDQLKKGEFRRDFIFRFILLPYLAGMFIVGVTDFANITTIMIYFFVGFILIMSSLMFSSRTIKILVYRDEPQKVSYFAIGILLVIIVFYRTLYDLGIGCKGYFDFIFCCNCSA